MIGGGIRDTFLFLMALALMKPSLVFLFGGRHRGFARSAYALG
jgi:hypothetical protein